MRPGICAVRGLDATARVDTNMHFLTFLLLLLLALEGLVEPVLQRVHALEEGGLHEREQGEELRQVVLSVRIRRRMV